MITVYEIMGAAAFMLGVIPLFTGQYEIAATAFAMAAYLQAVGNSKALKK